MKTRKHINWSKQASKTVMLGAAMSGALLACPLAQADGFEDVDFFNKNKVGDIFVILMENHNLIQPTNVTSPQQILGNPAAPYQNSLITPGNSNAVQVSYALAYYNTGNGVHPSEPNYVWDESGSDFGFHSDSDPKPANGNTFYDNAKGPISSINASGTKVVFWHNTQTPHLTGLLDRSGIPWKNYQEDVELSASPTNSASGIGAPTNIFNGSTQYNYAVKHNPAAFFGDTAEENVFPLAQLFADLDDNAVGKFNWITPDQYNDAHSALNGGFTYQGVPYTGDQASIAQGDNFLSIVIPEIMASKAYQNNGVIIILWDETENGDTSSFILPEMIISPLAKGNAYASTAPLSHSSDLKTFEEVFGLPPVNNPIPLSETNVFGGYNNVALVNDLSDLFKTGTIPAPANLSVSEGPFITDPFTHNVRQTVFITNDGNTPVSAPLFLALDNLSSDATLLNSDGATQILVPLGSPYIQVPVGGFGFSNGALFPHQSAQVTLLFQDPSAGAITYTARALNVTPAT
jgi:hypothetical protein